MDRLNEILNAYKIPLGLSFVGLVLLIGGIFSSNLIQKPQVQKQEFPKESIVSQSNLEDIKIDVSGAVNSPGVFTLDKESRIEDAVRMAGGFSEKVNKEFVSKKLNLSQKVTDGLKLYIPFEDEDVSIPVPAVAGAATSVSASGSKTGINSADQASLESLPGIGPVTAKKIIDNRPYSSLEELLSKKAVSKAVYTKILDSIDLN